MEGLSLDLNIYNLIGGTIFSGIGFVALVWAKKESEIRPGILGLALMVFPFFITQTVLLYLVGAALTAALFFWR